jgi:hypothetical protein
MKTKILHYLFLATFCLSVQNVVNAQSERVVFDQNATTDNITYLMAANTVRPSSASVQDYGAPKHAWLNMFNNITDQLIWEVELEEAASYNVTVLIDQNSASEDSYTLSVEGSSDSDSSITFSASGNDWQRVSAGAISIPAGVSNIVLKKNTTNAGGVDLKSFELIRTTEQAAYDARVAAFKADLTKFKGYRYGIMQQYGAWGFPETGTAKDMETWANEFDVDSWVQDMKDLGADYVVWSVTWWRYTMPAPITAVNTIVGNSERTTERDLLGEVANALEAEGIDLYFYYHLGQETSYNGGYGLGDWWQAQDYPDTFNGWATGDKTTFFNNWESVISEIGNRYGDKLDGWFFDDGITYYPAPFESLGTAARAGNPDRLISYNQWIVAHYTDFQDVYFGEHHRLPKEGDEGYLTESGQAGLFGHNMYRLENDWGIRSENQSISALSHNTASGLYSLVKESTDLGFPTTFNMLMYEDGTLFQESVDAVLGMKDLLDTEEVEDPAIYINDNDSKIIKTGNWSYADNRSSDYNNDVSYTRVNGAYIEYTFSQSSIELIGPTDDNYGEIEVFIDNVSQGVFSTSTTGDYIAQAVYFSISGLSSGSHTIKVVKLNGNFIHIDAIRHKYENLALNKTSFQSSTRYGGVASRGNDGNTNGDFNVGNSVTHTDNRQTTVEDYWEVDLGELANIEVIRVWHRTDCCSFRMSDFNIFISENPFTETTVAGTASQEGVTQFTFSGDVGLVTEFDTSGTEGRYIRLQQNSTTNAINFAELQVFGEFSENSNSLSLEDTILDQSFGLYPNPASKKVTLSYVSKAVVGKKDLVIYNLSTGQIAKSYKVNLSSGNNQIDIDISDIPMGLYYVQINKGRGQKLIVQ